MKTAGILSLLALGAVLTSAAAGSFRASLDTPKVALIGQTGTAGQVRVVASYSGFPGAPNLDVHSTAAGVSFDALEIIDNGGSGKFHFTIVYTVAAPAKFGVEVVAHDGTTGGSRGSLIAREIVVQRK